MKKYEQIVEYYKKEITNGNLKENDRLPTEEAIAQKFNVTRVTANKAIGVLQEENLVRKVKGKGTFVSRFRYKSNLVGANSFNEQMESLNIKPNKTLINYQLFESDILPDLKEKMNIQSGELIHFITRVFHANDIPIAVAYTYITPKYFNKVDAKGVLGSIYEMLKKAGAIFAHSDTEMTALMSNEEQKRLLHIDDEAMLKATTWLYDQDDDLIEYSEVFYVGLKYNYCVHINKNGEIYEQ